MKSLKIPKIFSFALFPFIFLFVLFLFSSPYKEVSAQIPEPYVTCGKTKQKEFHSLRPYQASPCRIPIDNSDFGPQAVMCGNDLTVQDKIKVSPSQIENCTHEENGYKCHFKKNRDFYISLNSFDSEYPIAGNTELISTDKPPIGTSKKNRLSDFSPKHLPPDMNEFDNYQDYYKAYQRWRGKSCLSIPIPIIKKDVILCFDNPFKPNYWSKIFLNIPYSSTEDRIGKIEVSDIQEDPSTTDVDVENLDTEWLFKDKNKRNQNTKNNEMTLYFPHMEEDVELTSLLQSTYLPPEIMENKQPIGETEPVPTGEHCKIANIRHNPGDKLFGETIKAHIKYTAEFDCSFPINPLTGLPKGTCEKTATFSSKVTTHVPMVDELWSKTVSGNASVIKRFFPKMEAGAPIEKPEDIPASSQIVHSAENASITSTNSEFYFPHMGGIYDYFLHDMQTALRPKGYGSSPLGLDSNQKIYESDAVNEYLSWYLNGTLYHAENNPIDVNPNIIEKLSGKKSDVDRLINYSGPLNKLLSQQSQWRNSFKFNSASYKGEKAEQGRVNQIEKAKKSRHDQIVGCTMKVPLLGKNLGIPIACKMEFMESLPSEGEIPPEPGTEECPYSKVPSMESSSSCQLSYSSIGASQIPPLMKKVFEAAGAKNGVPPDLIAGVMYSEGGFEPRTTNSSCYGEPDGQYTEEVIKNAVLCEFKNCNPNKYNPPCNYNSNDNMCGSTSSYGPYQQCPDGFNPCNFYDSVMHAAAKLARDRYGLGSIEEYKQSGDGSTSCAGYNYNMGSISGSRGCSKSAWTCEDAVTALRFETGSCIEDHFRYALSIFGKCL